MKSNNLELRTKYLKYIVFEKSEAFGNCEKVCRKITELEPDLRLVRGHYYCSVWGERQHWWLEDEGGNVFDPTCEQFPTKGNGVYVEWDNSQPEPTGLCPQCGEYIYNNEGYTHKKCAKDYVDYVLGR